MFDRLTPAQKALLKKWVFRLAVMAVTAALGWLARWAGVDPERIEIPVEKIIEKQVPVPAKELDEFEGIIDRNGWQPDGEASAKDAAVVPFRTFADTPAGQVAALPRQVFLWQAESKLTGKPTPLKDQNPEGSCVGFGTTTAVERTLAAEILARGGDPSEFAHFSEEVTYVGSRTLGATAAGGRPMNARSQGSAGVYAKAFLTGWGMVPEGKYGGLDLTNYSAARAAQWRSTGVPKDLEPVAKKYPVKSAAKVTTWKEAKSALASGYAVSVCATWSYSRDRDANGVARPTGEGWNHCMCLDGYIVLDDGREFGHVENSWSDLPDRSGRRTGQSYHRGPTGWGNPTTGGFWAEASSLDRALRQGESYAYSGVTGFPARNLKIDWFVGTPRLRPLPDRLFATREPGFALAW